MRVSLLFEPHPQSSIIAIDTLPRHPGGGHARVEGALQHLPCQLRLGREGPLWRNPRALTALLVVGPLLGQIEFTIKQDVALGTCIGHKHVSPQKSEAESPCPGGWPRRRKSGIMARNTRHLLPLEPAALCLKTLTCTAS